MDFIAEGFIQAFRMLLMMDEETTVIVVALIGIEDGKASAVVGVTDDLAQGKGAKTLSAVELVKAGVAALGGKGGGGRPDMAQGGGPDAAKAPDALRAIEAAVGAAGPK